MVCKTHFDLRGVDAAIFRAYLSFTFCAELYLFPERVTFLNHVITHAQYHKGAERPKNLATPDGAQ